MSEKEKNRENNQKKFDLQERIIELPCSQIAFGNKQKNEQKIVLKKYSSFFLCVLCVFARTFIFTTTCC